MKIKTKKELNLPQLIEYIFKNELRHKWKDSDNTSAYVQVYDDGQLVVEKCTKDSIFTVEVEEEIDEYTVFHTLVKVIEDGTVYTCTDATINREKNSAVVEIHAILNGVLKLIWTHEKGLVG